LTDFSLHKWKEYHHVETYLQSVELLKLIEDLGIKPFLQDNTCNRLDEPFSPSRHGFKSGL